MFLLRETPVARVCVQRSVIGICDCVSVSLRVRTLKRKRLGLSTTPNLNSTQHCTGYVSETVHIVSTIKSCRSYNNFDSNSTEKSHLSHLWTIFFVNVRYILLPLFYENALIDDENAFE